MFEKTKIVMINYLNARPFEFGLRQADINSSFDLTTATPAKCAEIFINAEADIALVPVGALPEIADYKIISNFAIACDGVVRTVCIFANQDIKSCHKIYLDDHSRTSFLLSKLILEQYLHLDIEYVKADVEVTKLNFGEAVLMIGDKVFKYENNFLFKYDLGSIWKDWTGLPFVFAVWIAKKNISKTKEDALNAALMFGLKQLDAIIAKESNENLDLYYYFNNNIHYYLDEYKNKGLQLFLEKIKTLKINTIHMY
ncbi:MAG: menaquinone biosynthesis protein [Saprospiraceae bacterium]|nr:menaquinone biosynthesis protein [Saprospiraceae bacterium]